MMTLKNDAVSLVFHLLLLLLLLPCAAAQADDPAQPPSSAFNVGTVFNPNMAIIMIVMICAFFALAFISVYLRQCTESRIRGGAASDTGFFFGDLRWSRRAGHGVGDEVIRTLPTFRYSTVKGLKIGKGALECAVCLNEFEDHETLRLLPRCSHVFHKDCVDAWLSSHDTCPVCRSNLLLATPGQNSGSTTVQVLDRSIENGRQLNSIRQNPEPISGSPEVSTGSPVLWNDQNRRSTRLLSVISFPRSHSTGHSPVHNCERFTLTLPEEVHTKIMNSSSNFDRTKSLGMLPRARSERKGYKSGSSSGEGLDRGTRPDRWGFGSIPSIISRTGLVRSTGSPEETMVDRNHQQRSLLQSFRNPVDHLFLGLDDTGGRSSDNLRVSYQV